MICNKNCDTFLFKININKYEKKNQFFNIDDILFLN